MSDIDEMRRALLVAQTALQLALAGIDEALNPPPPIKANPCRSCGASASYCDAEVFGRYNRACCFTCRLNDTHDMTLEDWERFRDSLRKEQ